MEDRQERSDRKDRHDRQRKRGFFWMLKRGLSIMVSLCITAVIGLGILLLYLRTQTLPTTFIPETSQIFDLNGNLIDAFYSGQNRNTVSIDDISPYLVQATLAIEDRRFYDHSGIDLKGLARAVYVNVTQMRKAQGASTITQQLARNLYLTHDRTWNRKLQEAILSLQIEMQYDKQTILEQYLNQIYYGHRAYGIQSAAQLFFGKNASELTLAESALLAGVPKGPKYYSPYMDEKNAKQRQRIVLNAMVDNGFISSVQAEEAYQEPLNYKPLTGDEPSKAPYFRDYIRYLAIEQLGIDERLYEEGGIRVYTTLDIRAQEIAEEVVNKTLASQDPELQAALIAIDPRNGYIKAMVGGRDYSQNQYNRVFTTSRQPGSSFKPFVYLTALQSGAFTPTTIVDSEPTMFTYDSGRKSYSPRNYGDRYYGRIDLRAAMSRSDNIYAVHTAMEVGPEQVIEVARKLGIESPMQALPSLALGTYPVSPFEMVYAFGVIANQGVKTEPIAILRIEDAKGNILYEAVPHEERVVEAEHTYVLTKLMESVFDPGGTGSRVASIFKRPVAGKTGTTNADAWMVGFTPELATAVWVGYDKGRNISTMEEYLSAPIFAEFTEQTLSAVPPKIFPIPSGVVSAYIDPSTGHIATPDCPEARLEWFVKGTEPVEFCSTHGHAESAPLEPSLPEQEDQRSWWENFKRWWGG